MADCNHMSNEKNQAEPKITVITVVLNDCQSIVKTIESVLSQTYLEVEYIIVDGQSTDGTIDLIAPYQNRVSKYISEEDAGIYDAMNKGLKLAKGSWICMMNSGDCFASNDVLEKVAKEISNNADKKVIYSDVTYDYITYKKNFKSNIYKNRFIHQGIIYLKELHDSVGMMYPVYSGLTISDFLFFSLIDRKYWHKINFTIAICSPFGVSAKLKTVRFKILIQILLTDCGYLRAITIILIHPIYFYIKNFKNNMYKILTTCFK